MNKPSIGDTNPYLFWDADYYGDEFEEVMEDEYGDDWEKQFNDKWDELKRQKEEEKKEWERKYQEMINKKNEQ